MKAEPVGLSLVVPVFDVREYLPAFLDSLGRQRTEGCDLEVVFVDDGSTDDSPDLIEDWVRRHPHMGARLIQQPNQGVSAARNRGLDAATREWISFPDPDDALADGYLQAVRRFLSTHGSRIDAATAAILRIDEGRQRVRDIHPLRTRFSRGSRVVDLSQEPDVILLNVATAFFPRSRLISAGIRFTVGLHASEDALFVADWFLSLSRAPQVGLVAGARYLYRRRAAGTSAVDGYRRRPATYIDRFRDGYLPRLQHARLGAAPVWLQHVLLYEYRWLFDAQTRGSTYGAALDDGQRAEVLRVTRACLQYVDNAAIDGYNATPLGLETRFLLRALKGGDLPPAGPFVTRVRQDRVECRWMTVAGAPPPPIAPDAKRRVPDYFGQKHIVEWIAWLPRSAVDPRAAILPAGASLARWSPLSRQRSSLSWRARSIVRHARATWASRIGALRLVAALRTRDLWVIVPTGLPARTVAELTARARLHGRVLVTLPIAATASLGAISRRQVLTMLNAAVVISSAALAEKVAVSHPQGTHRRWLGVAILDRALGRAETASLESAAVDLIAATTLDLAATAIAPDSNLGYTPADVVTAAPEVVIASIEERLRTSTRRKRSPI